MKDPSKGIPGIADSWVYIPGNHDYKIWDMLATRVVCEDVLRDGYPMGFIPTPLKQYTWYGLESFFAGIFKPFGAHDQVIVKYPNHDVIFGEDIAVFTHGHYLDPSQTWWNDLHREISSTNSPEERTKCIRRIFIETAQYQTAANAVSFTKRTRGLINELVGPEGFINKLHKTFVNLGSWIIKLMFIIDKTIGKNISMNQLINIETYVTSFCGYPKIPRWFIFGHTHHQDVARTPKLGIEVYNVGSFYMDRGMPMTFLKIEFRENKSPSFKLMCINNSGNALQVKP
jgi:hypothetical protein